MALNTSSADGPESRRVSPERIPTTTPRSDSPHPVPRRLNFSAPRRLDFSSKQDMSKSRTASPNKDVTIPRSVSPHPVISTPLECSSKQDPPKSRPDSPRRPISPPRSVSPHPVVPAPLDCSPDDMSSDKDYSCNKRAPKRRRSGSVSMFSPDEVERSNGGVPPLTKMIPPGNIKQENAAAKKRGSTEMRSERGVPM